MEYKKANRKKTFFEAIGDLFFTDYLFKREMVNKKHCFHIMQREELRTCRILSFGAILLELLFLITDLIFTRTRFAHTELYISAEIIMIVVSIAMILVSKFLIVTDKYQLMRMIMILVFLKDYHS